MGGFMKTFRTLAFAAQGFVMLSATAANAAGFVCERQAAPSVFTSNGKPRGNWTVQNTGNYNYVAAPGDDVYQHKSLSLTIKTLCSRGVSWDLGVRKNDHNGLEDACGTWSQAVTYSSRPSNCGNGFTMSKDKGQCSREAAPRRFAANRVPGGNWTVQNTSNFTYIDIAAPAEDFYRQNNNTARVVSTLCKRNGPGGWDYGERYYDYSALKDMCGSWIPAQSAMTVAASCPAGHLLTFTP